jgi:hypothetical protein
MTANQKVVCPFCAIEWDKPSKHFLPNVTLHKFMEQELLKDKEKLTESQREQLARDTARRIVNNELKVIKDRKDILANEETKVVDNGKHKLLELISDETTFYMVKVPN